MIIKSGDILVCKKKDTLGMYPDTLHLLEVGKKYMVENVGAINSTIGLMRAYVMINGRPIQFFYTPDIELVREMLERTKHKDEIDYVNRLINDCTEWGLLTYFDSVENYRELQLDKIV